MTDNNQLSGVLNINKPPNITSHDVVSHVRRTLNVQQIKKTNLKVGHTGTLDPFATGVLLIALGPATRLIEYSHDQDKEYEVIITLGATSDTDDITGKISKLEPSKKEEITKQKIKKTLKKFIGTIKQVPPIYSAIKIKGERSYKLARQGSDHSMPTKTITIHAIKLKNYKYPDISLQIICSTGTYIRSLARDIGSALNTGAYVKQLNRSRIGLYKIENSIKLNELTAINTKKHLIPTKTLVSHLPSINLTDDNVAQFYKGQAIGNREVKQQLSNPLKIAKKNALNEQKGFIAIFNSHNALLGIGYYDYSTHLLHPKKVLPPPLKKLRCTAPTDISSF